MLEDDCWIRSKVIKGSQNLEIMSRDPGHAHLGVVLWSLRREPPFYISVPNLKRIALFVQTSLGVSQNLEIRSRDLGHAHLRVVLYSLRRIGLRHPSLYQIWSGFLNSFKSY